MYVYESLCGHVQLFPDQVSSGNLTVKHEPGLVVCFNALEQGSLIIHLLI